MAGFKMAVCAVWGSKWLWLFLYKVRGGLKKIRRSRTYMTAATGPYVVVRFDFCICRVIFDEEKG